MKKVISISTLFLLLLTSCEKVININLNETDPEIIIEAIITDIPGGTQTVKLTKSVNFDDSNIVPNVSGATVSITDELGNSFLLTETQPGLYTTNQFQGFPDQIYFLTVSVDGKTFTSQCRMPEKVNCQALEFQNAIVHGQIEPNYFVIPKFNDPTGKGNYYRFRIQNLTTGKSSSNIMLISDDIADGGVNSAPIVDQRLTIKSGDSISVEMMCIDKTVYDYFFSLSQNGNGPNASATPANPITNIQGAKLGYFSANTSQKIQIIVP